ncbi:MAG: M1 family metallopeptidase [Candidatus Lokiarchaeota archaeon]|nr:M1 family metallopeptidase [Candidatus Lokiarchaeota archaeon]
MYCIIISFYLCFNGFLYIDQVPKFSNETIAGPNNPKLDANENPKLSLNGGEYSHYNLSVQLDDLTSTLTGVLKVDFYNNDPVNFTKLPFHIYLSGMAFISRSGIIDIISVNKSDISKKSLAYDEYPANQTMWVHLDTILEPLQRVQFEINFSATLPDGGMDRSNSHGDDFDHSRIYKCAGFYPTPCVYDSYDGWNTDPYLWVGDPFYYDMAYYDFYITVPKGMVVAATGELVQKIDDGDFTHYYFDPIHPVREVTFSASKYFYYDSDTVNGVNVTTYYLPKSQFLWENNAINYAIQALELFNETFGEYPYPTLNIVQEYTHHGGMEYPCQVYITESLDEWDYPLFWLESIIVHETGHQWWYNLVGNDEVDWGFLDEGLVCWLTSYYGEINYGNWEFFQYPPYIDKVRTYYTFEGLSSKINASVYDAVNASNYYYTAYTKAPLIFEKLRRSIGNTIFLTGLRLFYSQKVYKIALLSDLQQAMESVYGSSLDWFFFPWFDNFYLPKYNFLECSYDGNQQILNLTINDLSEPLNDYIYSQQVQLLIYDSSGLALDEWMWINGTTARTISLSNKPKKVRLEYGDEVLVQLYSEYETYIEKELEKPDKISGYGISILLLFCLVPLIYIISKFSINQKKKSKI